VYVHAHYAAGFESHANSCRRLCNIGTFFTIVWLEMHLIYDTCVLYYFDCSPYDGKWSKSMIGYGAEDSHFVLELTYNYGIGSYKLGNDFQVYI